MMPTFAVLLFGAIFIAVTFCLIQEVLDIDAND